MKSHTRSENGDVASPRSSRATSFSSERTSMSTIIMIPSPLSISPAPAYVAVAAASQIVTDQHNSLLREQLGLHDASSPIEDVALFSEGAMILINSFLDHLLYTFLSTARATSLSALRPAIVDVLKPKLAREAINTADQELHDLLAGDPEDEQDEDIEQHDSDKKTQWDLLKVWKRARLRVMVYTRFSEIEEEDEETYIFEMEKQDGETGSRGPASTKGGVVSWASAIFLTSIVEHVAEQAVTICGQAAFAKAVSKRRKSVQGSADGENANVYSERVVIEESDAEKLALNPTLGKLWRTWRKRVRGSSSVHSPQLRKHIRGLSSNSLQYQPSFDGSVLTGSNEEDVSIDQEIGPEPTERDIAANIALPMNDNDINEIEVPGLAKQFDEMDDDGTQTPAVVPPQRPHSFIFLSPSTIENSFGSRRSLRQRPISLPPPIMAQFEPYLPSSADDSPADFETPLEAAPEPKSYIAAESVNEEHELQTNTTSSDDTTGVMTAPESVARGNEEVDDTPELAAVKEPGSDDQDGDKTKPTTEEVSEGQRPSTDTARPIRNSSRYSQVYTPVSAEAIGVALTPPDSRAVPTPSPEPVVPVSARLSGSDLVGMPNVEYYLDSPENRPVSQHLAPAPAVPVKESPGEVSPISETFAPRTSSRNVVLSPVQEIFPQSTSIEPKVSQYTFPERTSVSSAQEKARDRRSNDSVSSIGKQKQQVEDGGRASLQRISSGSQSGSVSSSILHKAHPSDSSGRPRGLSDRMSEQDREKEFDSMVSREETVKYTLTPQSVREMDARALAARESGTSVTDTTPSRQQRNSPSTPTPSSASRSTPSTRPPPTNTKRYGPTAREPRVQTDSMRDFADFIRTTGPVKQTEEVQPILTASPNTKGSFGRRLSTRSRSLSGGNVKGSQDGPTTRPRVQLEPRSPVSPPNNDNGELIDFIRKGPPDSSRHRIERSIAPFRTTMDSDELNNLYSPDQSESVLSVTSKTSTNNSNTALLSSTRTAQNAYANSAQSSNSRGAPVPVTSETGPVRTRRRVKDPYAIDLSDDEEDVLTSLPKQRPQRQEESLIDFLRNVPPPSKNEPAPIVTAGSVPRKPNGLNLNGNGNAIQNERVPYDTPNDLRAPPLSPLAAHPQPVNAGSRLTRPKQSPTGGARDARLQSSRGGHRTDTADLADFLRSSAPPEPNPPRPSTSASKSSQRSDWRFWRKKTADV